MLSSPYLFSYHSVYPRVGAPRCLFAKEDSRQRKTNMEKDVKGKKRVDTQHWDGQSERERERPVSFIRHYKVKLNAYFKGFNAFSRAHRRPTLTRTMIRSTGGSYCHDENSILL